MRNRCDNYRGKWYIAYYLSGEYGAIEKYKPSKYKNSKEVLVDGGILSMNKSKKDMLEFNEYKGKVYRRIG